MNNRYNYIQCRSSVVPGEETNSANFSRDVIYATNNRNVPLQVHNQFRTVPRQYDDSDCVYYKPIQCTCTTTNTVPPFNRCISEVSGVRNNLPERISQFAKYQSEREATEEEEYIERNQNRCEPYQQQYPKRPLFRNQTNEGRDSVRDSQFSQSDDGEQFDEFNETKYARGFLGTAKPALQTDWRRVKESATQHQGYSRTNSGEIPTQVLEYKRVPLQSVPHHQRQYVPLNQEVNDLNLEAITYNQAASGFRTATVPISGVKKRNNFQHGTDYWTNYSDEVVIQQQDSYSPSSSVYSKSASRSKKSLLKELSGHHQASDDFNKKPAYLRDSSGFKVSSTQEPLLKEFTIPNHKFDDSEEAEATTYTQAASGFIKVTRRAPLDLDRSADQASVHHQFQYPILLSGKVPSKDDQRYWKGDRNGERTSLTLHQSSENHAEISHLRESDPDNTKSKLGKIQSTKLAVIQSNKLATAQSNKLATTQSNKLATILSNNLATIHSTELAQIHSHEWTQTGEQPVQIRDEPNPKRFRSNQSVQTLPTTKKVSIHGSTNNEQSTPNRESVLDRSLKGPSLESDVNISSPQRPQVVTAAKLKRPDTITTSQGKNFEKDLVILQSLTTEEIQEILQTLPPGTQYEDIVEVIEQDPQLIELLHRKILSNQNQASKQSLNASRQDIPPIKNETNAFRPVNETDISTFSYPSKLTIRKTDIAIATSRTHRTVNEAPDSTSLTHRTVDETPDSTSKTNRAVTESPASTSKTNRAVSEINPPNPLSDIKQQVNNPSCLEAQGLLLSAQQLLLDAAQNLVKHQGNCTSPRVKVNQNYRISPGKNNKKPCSTSPGNNDKKLCSSTSVHNQNDRGKKVCPIFKASPMPDFYRSNKKKFEKAANLPKHGTTATIGSTCASLCNCIANIEQILETYRNKCEGHNQRIKSHPKRTLAGNASPRLSPSNNLQNGGNKPFQLDRTSSSDKTSANETVGLELPKVSNEREPLQTREVSNSQPSSKLPETNDANIFQLTISQRHSFSESQDKEISQFGSGGQSREPSQGLDSINNNFTNLQKHQPKQQISTNRSDENKLASYTGKPIELDSAILPWQEISSITAPKVITDQNSVLISTYQVEYQKMLPDQPSGKEAGRNSILSPPNNVDHQQAQQEQPLKNKQDLLQRNHLPMDQRQKQQHQKEQSKQELIVQKQQIVAQEHEIQLEWKQRKRPSEHQESQRQQQVDKMINSNQQSQSRRSSDDKYPRNLSKTSNIRSAEVTERNAELQKKQADLDKLMASNFSITDWDGLMNNKPARNPPKNLSQSQPPRNTSLEKTATKRKERMEPWEHSSNKKAKAVVEIPPKNGTINQHTYSNQLHGNTSSSPKDISVSSNNTNVKKLLPEVSDSLDNLPTILLQSIKNLPKNSSIHIHIDRTETIEEEIIVKDPTSESSATAKPKKPMPTVSETSRNTSKPVPTVSETSGSTADTSEVSQASQFHPLFQLYPPNQAACPLNTYQSSCFAYPNFPAMSYFPTNPSIRSYFGEHNGSPGNKPNHRDTSIQNTPMCCYPCNLFDTNVINTSAAGPSSLLDKKVGSSKCGLTDETQCTDNNHGHLYPDSTNESNDYIIAGCVYKPYFEIKKPKRRCSRGSRIKRKSKPCQCSKCLELCNSVCPKKNPGGCSPQQLK